MYNYRTYSDLASEIANNIQRIPSEISCVVGVPRSGNIPANMIALALHLPCQDINSFIFSNTSSFGLTRHKQPSIDIKPKILVVDDSINTGESFHAVQSRLSHLEDLFEFIYLAIYAPFKNHPSSKDIIIFSICPRPRFFQWNYKHHNVVSRSCVDIDGVLCVDPSDDQNDDGDKYIEFIRNAKPLFIPPFKIRYIVTSRLEKYREHTEFWLSKHNISYDELVMLDLSSKQERLRLKAHAFHKADIYKKKDDAVLFIESDWGQSKKIVELTGKPVICTANDILITPSNIGFYNSQAPSLSNQQNERPRSADSANGALYSASESARSLFISFLRRVGLYYFVRNVYRAIR